MDKLRLSILLTLLVVLLASCASTSVTTSDGYKWEIHASQAKSFGKMIEISQTTVKSTYTLEDGSVHDFDLRLNEGNLEFLEGDFIYICEGGEGGAYTCKSYATVKDGMSFQVYRQLATQQNLVPLP